MSVCMSGTHGSVDVLVRGVGGGCDMYMCMGSVGHVSAFWLRWCRWGVGLDQGRERWGGVMSV